MMVRRARFVLMALASGLHAGRNALGAKVAFASSMSLQNDFAKFRRKGRSLEGTDFFRNLPEPTKIVMFIVTLGETLERAEEKILLDVHQ